jgi:hypothetical protein
LIARRSTRIRFADGAGAAPALRVTVDAAAPRAIGATLAIVWPDGSRAERRLDAPTCAEIADAIALVVVLALDPAAVSREPPAQPPRSAGPPPRAESSAARPRERPAPSPPTPTPPPPATPPAEEAAPPPPPPPEPPPIAPPLVEKPAPPPPPAEPETPAVRRLDVGAAFRVAVGPAPSLMPGIAVTAGWERDTSSVFSLKVALAAAHHARAWTSIDGNADFTLDVVTLHLCPLRVGPAGVRARVCATGSAGRLAAEGTDTLRTRSASRPFASAGGGAFLTVAPLPRVELTASVEPQAALIRDKFAFGPDVFHEVPAVVVFFGLGAAVTFP